MDLLAHLPKAIPITFNPYSKFEGHTSYVTGVAYLPGGQRIMTCSWDGSLRVWNLQTRKQIANDWGDGEDGVYLMRLSPDGKKVVSGDSEGAVKLWDVDTGKLEVIAKCTGINCHGVSVGWSGDSKRVVIGADDGTTRVWNVESGQTVLVIETGLSTMRAVIYSPDMTMIATGGYKRDEHLKIWDAKTGQLVTNIKGHEDSDLVLCLAWTADGKTLISATEVTIRTWNATTWQEVVTLRSRHASVIKGIVISPNDRILASAAYDHTTILWNLENGQAIVILHHRDPVLCTSFSPDGKLLATGCKDNKAYIWDISAFIKDAGLGDLPSNPNVDTTRRLGDWRRNPYRPPASFADDSPHHLSGSPNLLPPPTYRQHVSASPSSQQRPPTSHISPSRRNDHSTDDTPAQPRFLEWARNPFLNMRNRQNDETELQEHRPAVVDVPLAQARPRNYSAREVRRKQKQEQEQASNAREAEKQKARDAKNAKNTKSASLGSSRPSKSNVTQQPGGATQTQPTSKLHSAGVSTSSTTSVIAAASAGTAHWTRLWSAACCASAQNADGHH